MDARPRIFVSSTFTSREGGDGDVAAFRQRLQSKAADLNVEIILAEDDKRVKDAVARHDQVAILDGCARVAATCQGFVALLHERHGSGISLGFDGMESQARVSIFESELLQACVQKMSSLVLQVRGYEPEPALAEFLGLVAPAFQQPPRLVSEGDIGAEIAAFAQAITMQVAQPMSWIGDLLAWRRIRQKRHAEIVNPKLTFLNGGYRQVADGDVNMAVVSRALGAARAGFDPSLGPVTQGTKLSLLWMAIRELARASERQRASDLFELWSDVLGEWNRNAAWYGLHGVHPMGCLATLNTIAEAHAASGERRPQPVGARASAYYSCGGLARSTGLGRRYYRQALVLSEQEVRGKHKLERASALGLRGSCRARLAGSNPLHYLGALNDYGSALRLREKFDAGPMAVGESMVELGYAIGRFPVRRKSGLSLAERGVALMSSAPDLARNRGFYFRGVRKWADLLRRSGSRDQARQLLLQGEQQATDAEMHDQARQFAQLISDLQKDSTDGRA